MSINTATIMGRLTRDPNKTPAGNTNVCHFTVAVADRFSKDKTHFIEVDAWGSTAEFVSKYFHKGTMIAVTGSLEQSTWTGKDGEKKSKIIVRAENVSFCGGKDEEDSKKPLDERRPTKQEERPIVIDDDEDLPF